MELRVTLNGTDTNRWHSWGLTQNPFPQIAKAELDEAMRQLSSLDGDPLKGPEDIRWRLKGWSDEFIQLCINQFQPGKLTRFAVIIDNKWIDGSPWK